MRGKPFARNSRRRRFGLIPACAGKTKFSPPKTSTRKAHPRVCGENARSPQPPSKPPGSSPRVRGKPRALSASVTARGLIPACAGKTAAGGLQGHALQAHPRVCGENLLTGGKCEATQGSSPRVRGKLPITVERGGEQRLIPACAGKTGAWRYINTHSRAHPRVCGENRLPFSSTPFHAGSSPRVRGKRDEYGIALADSGLIPACAGKTERSSRRFRRRWAHPRVCGENISPLSLSGANPGSSPRVRGKHGNEKAHGVLTGLIPACAGKTRRRWVRVAEARAHPRVCGENFVVSGCDGLGGLIPACAGKTPGSWKPTPGRGAHPRVCGENALAAGFAELGEGSSPRVRGKRSFNSSRVFFDGLIPACAGKTLSPPATSSQPPAHPRVCGENSVRAC